MVNVEKNIEEIKALYPDEWVLVGNPKMDASELQVLSGVPVLHSKDKREVSYLGKSKTDEFETITLIYTGTLQSSRVMTGIFNSTPK